MSRRYFATGALRNSKHLHQQATEVGVLADWHLWLDNVDEVGNSSAMSW